ncbi:MAG: GTP-binding protein [Nanoarchaeota archaeon]
MVEYNKKIKDLEEQIAKTRYNKATSHAIGLYKAQLARLKEKQEARGSKKGKTEGYAVKRTGDATAVLVGFPSVGKSTILNRLTNQESEVAAYDFTTLTCIPGLLDYKHSKIQILDVPGIVRGASKGTGRGKEVLMVMRSADLAIIIVDVTKPEQYPVLLKEIRDAHIRVNARRPDIKIKKTSKDGVRIGKTVRMTHLDDQTIKDILKEFRIQNADVLIREDITDDQLIDVIEDNKKYIAGLTVLNKIDMVSRERAEAVMRKIKADIAISARDAAHVDGLKDLIFQRLNFMRVCMKEPGKPADMEIPLITFTGATIGDICNKLHRDFVDKFKFARVWGKSAKFPGQSLTLRHVMQDGDVLEIHLR